MTYRKRTVETWARAREDYLAGMTAQAVCRRYDLGLSAFKRRASEEGWRRADQDDPTPGIGDIDIYDDIDLRDQIRYARLRFNEALVEGQATQAARWRRLWETLRAERRVLDAKAFPEMTTAEIDNFLDEGYANRDAASLIP